MNLVNVELLKNIKRSFDVLKRILRLDDKRVDWSLDFANGVSGEFVKDDMTREGMRMRNCKFKLEKKILKLKFLY